MKSQWRVVAGVAADGFQSNNDERKEAMRESVVVMVDHCFHLVIRPMKKENIVYR